MNGAQNRWLKSTINSLSASTKLTIHTPDYIVRLGGLCSDLLSHKNAIFETNTNPTEGITIYNDKYSMKLDAKPEYEPYPVLGEYISVWEDIGLIPTTMLKKLYKRLQVFGINLETDNPLRQVYIAMPYVMGWYHGKPIYGSATADNVIRPFFNYEDNNGTHLGAGHIVDTDPIAEINNIKVYKATSADTRYPPFMFEELQFGTFDKADTDLYRIRPCYAKYDEDKKVFFINFYLPEDTPVFYDGKEVITLPACSYTIAKF